MRRNELKKRLVDEGFRSDSYILDGSEPVYDALVLSEVYGKWYIEYVERGTKNALGEFDSEDMACDRFYELLCKDITAKQ